MTRAGRRDGADNPAGRPGPDGPGSCRLRLGAHVDTLFANEAEILALYQVDDFDSALLRVRRYCEMVALTRGSRGLLVVSGDEVHVIDPLMDTAVDTTGAADLYAAGFLFGLSRGPDMVSCGLGSRAAAEVISHVGARPAVRRWDLAGGRLG